jgi:hypothetical protein
MHKQVSVVPLSGVFAGMADCDPEAGKEHQAAPLETQPGMMGYQPVEELVESGNLISEQLIPRGSLAVGCTLER